MVPKCLTEKPASLTGLPVWRTKVTGAGASGRQLAEDTWDLEKGAGRWSDSPRQINPLR